MSIWAGRIQGRQRHRQQVDDEAARAEHQKRSTGGDSGRNQVAQVFDPLIHATDPCLEAVMQLPRLLKKPTSEKIIIEQLAKLTVEKDKKTGRERITLIFPRVHQLDVVRSLLTHACQHGLGQTYLIRSRQAPASRTRSPGWPTNW